MEQIIEQLIEMNKKDVWDIVGIMIPIILTIVIIVQNIVFFKRNAELQKEITNREERNRYHNDIMRIYNVYYAFCDCILGSGFSNNVRIGNCNMAMAWMNNLIYLKQDIGRTKELAKLFLKKSDPEVYDIVDERLNLAIKIIDKYVDYISSGKLYGVSENAWNTICENLVMHKYNYQWLYQNKIKYDNYLKLCESDDIKEIEALLRTYEEQHSYENFDKYFEKYFSLNEIK